MATSTVTVSEGYALSNQQRIAWHKPPAEEQSVVQGIVRIEGALDRDCLTAAVASLFARHEALRTRIWCPPGLSIPLQFVSQEPSDQLTTVDLAELTVGAQLERFEQILHDARNGSGRSSSERVDSASAVLVWFGPDTAALVLSAPASLADAETVRLLPLELARHYCGSGPESAVIQYADYAAWQKQQQSEADVAASEHWRRAAGQLRGYLPAGDAAGPEAQAGPRRVTVHLDAGQLHGLAALGGDLQTAVLAAWVAWLWRVSRRESITIGELVDARCQDDELRSALGPFTRCLPLRIALDDDSNFESVLRSVIAGARDNRRYQESFDGKAFPELQFEYIQPAPRCDAERITFRLDSQRGNESPFRLKLECIGENGSMHLALVGDAGSLSHAALDRYAAQLASLLRAVSERPTTSLAELPLMGADDRTGILAFSGRQAPIPGGTIHERFEAQVRATPDAQALLAGNVALTFAELNARANRVAWVLRERGVKPDSLVGICVERSPDAIVASLAVLKAGAAFVPLDPGTLNPGKLGYPRERLKFMLQDVDPAILITQRKLAEDLPESRATLLPIDDPEHFEHTSSGDLPTRGTANSAAYAIYTSGSTGRPKAVVIEHRAALNLWAGLLEDIYAAHGKN